MTNINTENKKAVLTNSWWERALMDDYFDNVTDSLMMLIGLIMQMFSACANEIKTCTGGETRGVNGGYLESSN